MENGMLRISVCDEEKSASSAARRIAEEVLRECGQAGAVKEYNDSRMLMSDICEGERIDIAVLDIEMPHFSGMQIAAEIKKAFPECRIIFLTAYAKYAVESYELQIFRYALKDNFEEKLPRYIKDAITMLTVQEGEVLTAVYGNTAERIPYGKIMYIKKEGKYSVVYRTDGRKASLRKPLSDIKTELNMNEFVIADRACVVNITQISCINGSEIICKNGEHISVSRANLRDAKERIVRYFGNIV